MVVNRPCKDIVLPAEIEYLLHHPAVVPELESMPDRIMLKKGEKSFQPGHVQRERGRKLPENDRQFLAELEGALEKPLQQVPDFGNPLDVGDIPAPFDGKQEVRRRAPMPGTKYGL